MVFLENLNCNLKGKQQGLKLIYSEKGTKFCEISTVDLSYIVTVKSTMEVFQNFVAFSEYMNFTRIIIRFDKSLIFDPDPTLDQIKRKLSETKL